MAQEVVRINGCQNSEESEHMPLLHELRGSLEHPWRFGIGRVVSRILLREGMQFCLLRMVTNMEEPLIDPGLTRGTLVEAGPRKGV